MNNNFWPEKKKFAFTIIDDTDNSNLNNAPLVYDYLYTKGLLTTKSVWTRNGDNSKEYESLNGDTLENKDYLEWVKNLFNKGFEICLHSTSWSRSSREEIIESFSLFENYFGRSSTLIQHNDSRECESIYWGKKRLIFPLDIIFELLTYINPRGVKSSIYQGEIESSEYFWGDIAYEKVDFIRNLTFDEINLFNITNKVVHKRKRTKFVKNWFISSEAPDCQSFINLFTDANIQKLEDQNGLCIVYTHFGNNFVEDGKLNEEFKTIVDKIASKNGWFVPASDILIYLDKKIGISNLSYYEEFLMCAKWLAWKMLRGTS